MGAFGIQGLCGLLLTVLIGRNYGPAPLGLFNQVVALYIIASQLATIGVQFSAIKHVAVLHEDMDAARACALSAIILTLGTASLAAAAGYAGAPLLARLFQGDGLRLAWLIVLPGLVFFALNKTLLAVVNAFSHMRAFAVALASRSVLMLAALSGCVWYGVPPEYLTGILPCSEGLLSLGLLLYAWRSFGLRYLPGWRSWARQHLAFGAKSFLGGAVIELYSRMDVILLGLLCASNEQIGVYSMAALLVEGIAQVFGVVRNVINPKITQHVAQGRFDELAALRTRVARSSWLAALPCGVLAVIIYPHVLPMVSADPSFADSTSVFAILMAGLVVTAGYQPFMMALVLGGFPGQQTLLMSFILLVSILGNVLLIPALGINGAAFATASSMVFGVLLLKHLFRRQTGFPL